MTTVTAEEAEWLVEQIAEDPYRLIANNPLARRYTQKVQASRDNKIRTADDVLGERVVRLAMYVYAEKHNPGYVLGGHGRPDSGRVQDLAAIALTGLSGDPYLWSEEVRSSIKETPIPRHTLSPRLLPQPVTWHTFETGLALGGVLQDNGRTFIDGTCDAWLVYETKDGFTSVMFGAMTDQKTGEEVPYVGGATYEWGSVYPDDLGPEGDPKRTHLENVLLMFAFLNSPYIPKRQERASRSARRELAREGAVDSDQKVSFVILRRPDHARRSNGSSEEDVAWKHRWIVSGHMRAHWYPKEQAHHLIWIAPYVKGPEDAPMLGRAYKVAR